ncbi:MAG: TDP-N-acetylfucosamine:lipid II N-acetylfucosaminyltransferase [Phycisphaerales bacterium]
MIVHLLPGGMEHHVPEMIKFFAVNAAKLDVDAGAQLFVVFGADIADKSCYKDICLNGGQLVFYPNRCVDSHFLRMMTKADSLIIHSVFFPHIWRNVFLHPGLWRRTAIVNWGAGFQRRDSLRGRVLALLRRIMLPRLGAISTLVPGEFEEIQRCYGVCANYVRAFYTTLPAELECEPMDGRGTCRVLLGNSAWESNNHLEVLDWLHRYEAEDIEIVCPLAYPVGSSHAKDVMEVGHRLFGAKFRPLCQMMPRTQYTQLLNTIDVFVLNTSNQQALFAVYHLLAKGRKVYLRGESPTYQMLVQLGIVVHKVSDIAAHDLAGFRKLDTEISLENARKARMYFSIEAALDGWHTLIDRIRPSGRESR